MTLRTALTKKALAACLSWCALGLTGGQVALAQGKYIDIDLSGSYQRSYEDIGQSVRKSYGLELGLPLTSFLEVSLGHTLTEDRFEYNNTYKTALREKGYAFPEGTLLRVSQVLDTNVNAALGYAFGAIKPTFFGGALWRKTCKEEWWVDYGCSKADKPTWNAGVAVSLFVTHRLRFKVSYRLSPSFDFEKNKKTFDDQLSLGLTWGI